MWTKPKCGVKLYTDCSHKVHPHCSLLFLNTPPTLSHTHTHRVITLRQISPTQIFADVNSPPFPNSSTIPQVHRMNSVPQLNGRGWVFILLSAQENPEGTLRSFLKITLAMAEITPAPLEGGTRVFATIGTVLRKQVLSWSQLSPRHPGTLVIQRQENATSVAKSQQQPMGAAEFSGADTCPQLKQPIIQLHKTPTSSMAPLVANSRQTATLA